MIYQIVFYNLNKEDDFIYILKKDLYKSVDFFLIFIKILVKFILYILKLKGGLDIFYRKIIIVLFFFLKLIGRGNIYK